MAPRKNAVRVSKYPGSVSEKENNYLRGLSDYKTKVRRRESLRTSRCLKVSKWHFWARRCIVLGSYSSHDCSLWYWSNFPKNIWCVNKKARIMVLVFYLCLMCCLSSSSSHTRLFVSGYSLQVFGFYVFFFFLWCMKLLLLSETLNKGQMKPRKY